MSQDYLLEQLRQTRQRVFERKQEAFATRVHFIRQKSVSVKSKVNRLKHIPVSSKPRPNLRGTIEGHEVTVRVGQGKNEGATLIADGILSNKQFKGHSHHNHYGPDLKRGFGRIEDVDGDRGAYTGPGH